jgi:hypothetical protein
VSSPVVVRGVVERVVRKKKTGSIVIELQANSLNFAAASALAGEGVEIQGPVDVEMGEPAEDPNQTKIPGTDEE